MSCCLVWWNNKNTDCQEVKTPRFTGSLSCIRILHRFTTSLAIGDNIVYPISQLGKLRLSLTVGLQSERVSIKTRTQFGVTLTSSCKEVVPAAPPNQINTYPNSLWLHRRWRAIHPSRPCPPCHNPRALGDRRLVPRGPLKGLVWRKGTRAGCSPCSDRESRVPRFRNHWPSTLPVTEKAQQEPHMPCKTMVTVKALSSGPVQSAFLFLLLGLQPGSSLQ
jgi:hypothetical protein